MPVDTTFLSSYIKCLRKRGNEFSRLFFSMQPHDPIVWRLFFVPTLINSLKEKHNAPDLASAKLGLKVLTSVAKK